MIAARTMLFEIIDDLARLAHEACNRSFAIAIAELAYHVADLVAD